VGGVVVVAEVLGGVPVALVQAGVGLVALVEWAVDGVAVEGVGEDGGLSVGRVLGLGASGGAVNVVAVERLIWPPQSSNAAIV
jgi:hypothetical protein